MRRQKNIAPYSSNEVNDDSNKAELVIVELHEIEDELDQIKKKVNSKPFYF